MRPTALSRFTTLATPGADESEVFGGRVALHWISRLSTRTWMLLHPGGALHNYRGRRLAAWAAALDLLEGWWLRRGVFDGPLGQVKRSALDAFDAAVAEATITSLWPAGGGSQTIPIPMATETAYRYGVLRASGVVAPATIAVAGVRALRGGRSSCRISCYGQVFK